MKVSHSLNTDNLIPQPVAAPVAEEQIKCRRRKLSNSGDNTQQQSGAVSPQSPSIGEDILSCLSENEEIIPKTGSTKLANTTTQMHSRACKAFYVRLAEESPRRNYNDMSDSSTYGSFNCLETDICRDSSDTESNSSFTSGDMKTTIRVVEYDVASATNSEGLFTSDSSSGADDILIAATIYHKSKYSSDFADTEEDSSDTTSNYDSELTSADYWVCVKCKNKQNNPMFRFCEKCYQIRKTHFPPRPKLRKSRSLLKRNRSLPGGRDCSPVKRFTTSCNVNEKALKRKRRKATQQMDMDKYFSSITPTTSSNSIQNGSTNTPSRLTLGFSQDHLKGNAESCSEDDNKTANEYCKNTKNNFKETRLDKYILNSTVSKKMNEDQPAQRLQTAMKRRLSMDSLLKYKSSPKRTCSEEITASSIAQCDTENETDFALSQSLCGSQSTQRDSGFSSAPSSQERESSSSHQNDYDDEGCASNSDIAGASSDTVCDSDMSEMCEEKDCIPSALNTQEYSLDKHVSDMLPQTNSESHAIPTLVQSLSECSDAYTNMQASISVTDSLNIHSDKTENKLRSLQSRAENLIENERNSPNYGSCIACLTEPKNGVFVHSKFLHLCCCYKCAVKIWNKNKKCPICNCAVKNVMKLFVH